MDTLKPLADLVGRIFLSAIFIQSGLDKLGSLESTQGYMDSYGVPGVLAPLVVITEVGFGLLLLVGFQTRLMAFLLGGFTLLAALIFHAEFGDRMQMINLMKNIAIAGGMAVVFANGAGAWSVDGWRRR